MKVLLVMNTAVYITRSRRLVELGHEVSIVGHQDGFKITQLTTQLRKMG
jgi:hypothetical protein